MVRVSQPGSRDCRRKEAELMVEPRGVTFDSLTATGQKKRVIRSLAMLLIGLVGSVASARAAVYGFNMDPPTTTQNAAGQTIRITGGGSFDTALGTVLGNGSYSIADPAGKVVERGVWVATTFGSFDSQGGPNRGLQGGVLHISIALLPNGGTPRSNIPMTVICAFENGEFVEGEDATLVGDFVTATGGESVFHLILP
jgi:hypothetical protein